MSKTALEELQAIYVAYHAKVVGCATQFLGRDEADDVAQEVFVKIGRSLGTLSDTSKLRGAQPRVGRRPFGWPRSARSRRIVRGEPCDNAPVSRGSRRTCAGSTPAGVGSCSRS